MWIYNNKPINSTTDLPANTFGFIYVITNIFTGKFYVGKKYIKHKKTKKVGKKAQALQEGRGRKKTKEVSYEESDWLTYWGSSKPLLEDIKQLGEDCYERKIIDIAFSSKQLSYQEAKHQFHLNVLESNNCFNSNIQGRYYRADTGLLA